MTSTPNRCDIFCRVVDNYGDIGVCWRLARQLVAEHALRVRLVVDDLASFARIAPDLNIGAERQYLRGVEVVRWNEPTSVVDAADLVIEAFACELPAAYQAEMAARPVAPVWVNLEYLSAEDWVERHHLMQSPHPRLPLTKYFFMPGFTAATGGLLRERDALAAQAPQLPAGEPGQAVRVFLFGYEHAPVEALGVGALQAGVGLQVTAASEHFGAKLQHWRASQAESARKASPMLEIATQRFVPQEYFDALLREHDILFVRGEDSFVRAQWAGKPFVWHIYPQSDEAHWRKLDAFLDRYCARLAPVPAKALRDMWHAWNGDATVDAAGAWAAMLDCREVLQKHAVDWATALSRNLDLASNLLSFYRKIAKI